MATTPNVDNKRYQGLIISIALFLSLIGALLAFTFYTSNLLERNTALIDQTNQVANSAQAVIKDLFDFDFEDFTLENYSPDPGIKAPVAI